MSLALPIRLARREVWRRPGRTLLVALLVALPVAGMSLAVTIVRSGELTRAEEWAGDAGNADARYFSGRSEGVRVLPPGLEGKPDPAEDTFELPAGSRTIAITYGYARVRTADHEHRATIEPTDTPLDDRMTKGIVELLDGEAPDAAGEVALAPDVADRLDVGVGDQLVLDRPDLRLDVVGLVEQPTCLHCDTALFAHGLLPDELVPGTFPAPTLVDLPDDLPPGDLAELAALEDLETRTEYLDPDVVDDDAEDDIRWSYVVGAVALTVMGIVISAAFAVGARRQLVTIGQLSSSGAPPGTIRTMLVLQGTVTGLVGSVAGLAIAGVLLATLHDWFEQVTGHRFGAYEVRPLDHVGVVLIGVLAATIAALVPARTAARLPTLAALAGRRPLAPLSRRLFGLGVGGVAIGLGLLALAVLGSEGGAEGDVWVFVAILGGVCQLLGACAIAPFLVVRLEPLAGRVKGSLRLAARGLARHRTRTGAVVSAVAAAGALAIVSTALVRGADQQEDEYLDIAEDVVAVNQQTDRVISDELGIFETAVEPVDADVRAQIAAVLPEADRFETRTASLPPLERTPGQVVPVDRFLNIERPVGIGRFEGYGFTWATVADDQLLDLMGVSDSGREALAGSGIVLVRRWAEAPGEVMVGGDRRPVPVVAAQHVVGPGSELLVTEQAAQELGLQIGPGALVYVNPEPLSEEQRDLLEDIIEERSFTTETTATAEPDLVSTFIGLAFHQPSTGPSPFQLELILSGVALVFALFVVGASLALAAAESKDERDVLTVAGAPPGALARAAGARAWLLAGLGGLLAVPIGFLPVVVFTRAEDDEFPLVFPGTTVALLLVAVPLVVALVAFTTSATAQRLRPVRVSTATFE